jgi:PAS domain S-box-containing protein
MNTHGRNETASGPSNPVRLTVPYALFSAGIFLEILATIFQYNIGAFNSLDEVISAAAGAMVVVGALLAMYRFGQVTPLILVAAAFFLLSKALNVTRNIEVLNHLPMIGFDDRRSRAIENVSFVFGGLMLLGSFFYSHIQVHRARLDLAARHEALLRETEKRRHIAEALAESERKLQLVINRIPQEVYWKDCDSVYLGCNQRRAAAAGLASPADIAGRTDFEFPWTPEEADSFVHSDQQVISSGEPLHHLLEQRHNADGRVVWLETSKVPLVDAEGNITGVLGTSEDVTERRLLEEERARLVTAIEQAVESVMICDRDGVIQYVNPAFETITGYGRQEVIGRKPSLLKSGLQDDAFYKALWNTIRRGEVWHGHFINRRKDGSLYEEDATISPVRNEAAEIINFVALKRDVTKEISLERQLQQSSKMQALGTLASGIAHDFRNILSLVLGYCELAEAHLDKEHPATENVERIRQAGRRGASLIRQILTFTRQEPQERQMVCVAAIAREALDLLRPSIPSSVEILCDIDSSSGLVHADPTQIHQVMVNLCSNAYQSLHGNPGRIEVAVHDVHVESATLPAAGTLVPGDYVCLTVSDTGQGMNPDTLQHIFEPFFTTKGQAGGTGLGLSIVHGIVTGNDGAITVRSTLGRGTSFHIYLPKLFKSEAGSVAEEDADYHGHERVLLVDDEEDLVFMTQQLLEGLGYQAHGYTDGAAALRDFAADPEAFDVIVTDYVMPGMSGAVLSREILRIRPDMPVILMTGGGDTINTAQAKEMGICDLVSKPFSSRSLSLAIRHSLARGPVPSNDPPA